MIIGIIASQTSAPVGTAAPTLSLDDPYNCGYIVVRATNTDSEYVTMYIEGVNKGSVAPGAFVTHNYSVPEGRKYNVWARALKGGVYSDYAYLAGTKPSMCF